MEVALGAEITARAVRAKGDAHGGDVAQARRRSGEDGARRRMAVGDDRLVGAARA